MFRVLSSLAAGAAAMFFLDPVAGARRRALVRDKLVRAGHVAQRITAAKGERLVDRSRGLVAEVRGIVRRDSIDDEGLEARVRARLGRVASHPHAIATRARNGVVTVSGVVPARELDEVLAAIGSVRGVERVDSVLETGDPGRTPPRRRAAGAGTRRSASAEG